MCAKLWTILFLMQFGRKCVVSINKDECGYKQCPLTKDGALNVHLIPHSHMDAGWVKTFDQYYYGTKQQISTANVQLIYHSVLSELLHDQSRKFTLSETAYFWRWWKEQRASTRNVIKKLVEEGRLEFAGGGWVQNDEATSDYEAIIDSYTWGLRILNDTLGPCAKPKAAWQIDTYGHSREQASLMAQMGFDGLFISRVDFKEREAMIEEDRLEFIWRGSDVLGKMTDILTHTLFNLYNPPEGFCFDYLCNDEPIMEEPLSKSYNADKRVAEFIAYIEKQAKFYSHDNIVIMMGGDFTYLSAAGWYINMDKLINHINTHPANMSDINIFYSTPSCYLKSLYLHGKRDKGLYTEKADLFPYGTDPSTYWTGYFTSRPSLKYLIRKSQQFLQILKQLSVITRQDDSYELHLLRHAVSLANHHDAITGTSQQHVANDYVRVLTDALEQSSKKVSSLLAHLTQSWGGTRRPKSQYQFTVCFQLNISQCNISESSDSMLLLLYNPSSIKTSAVIRLPVLSSAHTITNAKNEDIEFQIVPVVSSIINLPGRQSNALQELYFEAESIPPLGFTSFHIIHQSNKEIVSSKQNEISGEIKERTNFITNELLKVVVNKDTGLLQSVQYLKGMKLKISQNFFSYIQIQNQQHSGAYSFRLNAKEASPVSLKATYSIVKGPIVSEIRQRFSDWITQIIRLYRGQEFVEFDWIIGPVPVGSDLGKEIVTRFTTNITNKDFYTDSNGRQMMKRTCMPSDEQQKKSIPACYYPVTSRICIRGQNTTVEMCVLPDRPQGGTSYNKGDIELMVHRRLLTDDEFGLDEALNEEAYGHGLVVRGQHRLMFGKPDYQKAASAALRWKYEPWMFMTSGAKITKKKWSSIRNKRFTVLHSHALPPHIHILTLEPWKTGSVLLRLENTKVDNYTFESNSIITVDLRTLFLKHHINKVREVTMPANQWLEDARQMDWSTRYVYDGGNDDISDDDNVVDYSADNEQSTEEIINDKKNPVKLRKSRNLNRFKRDVDIENRESPETNYDNIDEKTRHDILKDFIYLVLAGKPYQNKSFSDRSKDLFDNYSSVQQTTPDDKAMSIENAKYEYKVAHDELRNSAYESDDIQQTESPVLGTTTDSEDEEYTSLNINDDTIDERRYSKKDNDSSENNSNALEQKLTLLADLVKNIHSNFAKPLIEDHSTITELYMTTTNDADDEFDENLAIDDNDTTTYDVSEFSDESSEMLKPNSLLKIEDEVVKGMTDANKDSIEELFDTAGPHQLIPITEYKQDDSSDIFQRRVKRSHSGAFMPFLITWNEENTRELKDLINEHLGDKSELKKPKETFRDNSSFLPYLRNQATPKVERIKKAPRKAHFDLDTTTTIEPSSIEPTETTVFTTDYITTMKIRKSKLPSQKTEQNDEPRRNSLISEEIQSKRKKKQMKHVNDEGTSIKKKYNFFNDIDKFTSKPFSLFSETNYEDDDEKVPNTKNKGLFYSVDTENEYLDNTKNMDTNKGKEKDKKPKKYLFQSMHKYDADQDVAKYANKFTAMVTDLNDVNDKDSNSFSINVNRDKRKYLYDAKNSNKRRKYEHSTDLNKGPDMDSYTGNLRDKNYHKYIPRHPDRNIEKDIIDENSGKEKHKRKSKGKGKDKVKHKHSDQYKDIDNNVKIKKVDKNMEVSKDEITSSTDYPEPKRKSKKKSGRKKKNSKTRKAEKKQKKKKTKKKKKKGKRKSTTELPTTLYMDYDVRLKSENFKNSIDLNNKVAGMSIEKNEWMDGVEMNDFDNEFRKRRKRSATTPDDADTKLQVDTTASDQIEEYLVTLKPTQIRTFVVTFDNMRP